MIATFYMNCIWLGPTRDSFSYLGNKSFECAFTHVVQEPIPWDYIVGCFMLKHLLDSHVNEEDVVLPVSLLFIRFTFMDMYLCRTIMRTYMLPVLLNMHYKIFDNFLSCYDCQILHELDMTGTHMWFVQFVPFLTLAVLCQYEKIEINACKFFFK